MSASSGPGAPSRRRAVLSVESAPDVPPPDPRWAERGACNGAEPCVFFPTRGDPTEPARRICAVCVVRSECREYVLAHPGLRGVWAGMSEREREHIHGASARAAAPGPGDPAVRTLPTHSIDDALEELRRSPGRWARIARYTSVHSASCRASRLRRQHAGSFEFTSRVNDESGSDLFARYIGKARDIA